jgi:hypothetical protein
MAGQQLISYLEEEEDGRGGGGEEEEGERKNELQLPHKNYTLYSNWGILKHGVQG